MQFSILVFVENLLSALLLVIPALLQNRNPSQIIPPGYRRWYHWWRTPSQGLLVAVDLCVGASYVLNLYFLLLLLVFPPPLSL